MPSHKASHYLQLLNKAINAKNYSEIPEYSRKVRKHDPTRTCYARSVEIQAILLATWQSRQQQIDNDNLNSQSNSLSWLLLDKEDSRVYSDILKEAMSLKEQSSLEDRHYFDATYFFHLISTRELVLAQQIAPLIGREDNPCAVQVITLRGILFELTSSHQNAPRAYSDALSRPSSDSGPQPLIWKQFALYRLAILGPSKGYVDQYVKEHPYMIMSSHLRLTHVLSTRPNSKEYLQQLLLSTKFPPAEVTNIALLQSVTRVVESWLSSQDKLPRAEEILDLAYEATGKTFHSPRLLRYICHALGSLERFDECYLALKAYLQIAVHAQKTQPGADVDSALQIVELVNVIIADVFSKAPPGWHAYLKSREMCAQCTKFVSDLHIQDANVQAVMQEINAISCLLEYDAVRNVTLLDTAIKSLASAISTESTPARYLHLSRAYLQQNRPHKALSTIRLSLELNEQNPVALLFLANLLCCEELFDRALLVLSKLQPKSVARLCPHTIYCFKARIMELKIRAILDGAGKALEQSADTMSIFSQYFGVATEKSVLTHNNVELTTNLPTDTKAIFAPQIPRVVVEDAPYQHMNGHLTNGHHTTSPLKIDEEHFNRTHHIHDTGALRPPSQPPLRHGLRSASLKLSQQQRNKTSHHLLLRKSASTRTMRFRAPSMADNSSRSSSPVNHPTADSSFMMETIAVSETYTEQLVSDQASPKQLELAKYNIMLADLWLLVARLSVESNTSIADARLAITEARKLVGNTSDVITAELELNSALVELDDDSSSSAHDKSVIEQAYELAIDLEPNNAKTIISFVKFLLRQWHIATTQIDTKEPHSALGVLARGYELLESLKLSCSATNPEIWSLSADIAVLRNEEDRAEREFWTAVELSDCAGVMDWSALL